MAKKVWRLNKWYGGISTGNKIGIDGSFSFGQGLDFGSNPDLLQSNYALEKSSSTNVTGLPKWIVQNATTYYAYADDGKIHSNASSWTSLRTVANSGGQGMEIFNDYLYYTQDTQLGRYGALSGSPSFTDNYQTGLTDTSAHNFAPMKVFLNKLCVGHGRTISTLDDSATWVASAITLPIGWVIKSMEVRGDFLYIGCFKGTSVTDYEEGALFTWDGTSSTWNSAEFINESGVNALINQNDTIYAFAGTRGNIYQYVNGQYVKIKRIPNIGVGEYADVYPGAVTTFNGLLHFGTSGDTDSATLYQGVYTWGQVEKNYPYVLNYDYPISTGNTQATNISIGAVKAVSPTKLYVGWKDDSTYGIDLISTSNQQSTVVYESLLHDDNQPYRRKTYQDIKLLTSTLASGDSVVVKYKADRAAAWSTLGTFSFTTHGAQNNKKFAFKDSNVNFIKAFELEVRIESVSGVSIIEADIFFETNEGITDYQS